MSVELPPQVSEILEKALALSSDERGLMIDFLIYTPDHEPNAPAEEGVEAAWKEEIERRLEDIRTGRAKTIPFEQVVTRARALLRDTTAGDTARWFKKLDEFGPEPFGDESGTKRAQEIANSPSRRWAGKSKTHDSRSRGTHPFAKEGSGAVCRKDRAYTKVIGN